MVVFPDSAFRILGFDSIRDRISDLLSGEDSRERWAQTQPAVDVDEAKRRLSNAAEFQRLLLDGVAVRTGPAFLPAPALQRARPRGAALEVEELRDLADMMRAATDARSALSARSSACEGLWAIASAIEPTTALVEAVESAIDARGAVRDDASAALRSIRRRIGKSEAALRDSLDRALAHARSQGVDGGEHPTMRNGRMVIPIRAEAKRRFGGLIHDISSSGQTAFVEPAESLDLNNDLSELRAEEKQEIRRILIAMTDHVREAADAIQRNALILIELDVIGAIARFANAMRAIVPDIADEPGLALRAARHPILLLRALDATGDLDQAHRVVVPLDLELGRDANTLVLSGPNAGGKTVVLKTVGLFVLMAATGIPVPAADGTTVFLPRRLMLDIGDEQSVEDDLSTFGARIVHLRRILEDASPGSLNLIDEAGSGTDPVEGAALAQAILERLADSGAMTLATTHHQRLKVFAMQHRGVVNGSMLIDAASLAPTYRFRLGVAGSSYGLSIAERQGLAADVTGRARVLAGDESVELDRLLAEQAERVARLDEDRRILEAERGDLARERSDLQRRVRSLDAERAAAKKAAARLIDQANVRIEKTIREIVESGAAKKSTRAARTGLEEFRQELEEEARRAQPELPGSSPPAGGPVSPGDRVVIDDGETAAEVVSIEGNTVEVNTGSARIRVDRSRIRKVGGKPPQRFSVSGPEMDVAASSLPMRLDLRGARAADAVWQVTRHIDAAVTGGLHRVEILHGKGTGALRKAIRDYLGGRADVSDFDDAAIEEGGAGVTVVHLR